MADHSTSSSAVDAAMAIGQTAAGKAGAGMLGAVILYAVMPPLNKDGSWNRREFIARLLVAGLFSTFFGDWSVDIINHFADWLNPEKHRAAVYLLTGAPGWWVSRWAALWLRRRQDKDLGEVAVEVKSFPNSTPKGE